MSKKPTYKGGSMSQELASRLGAQGEGRNKLVGRKEYERKPQPQAKPVAPHGLGKF